MQNWFKGLKPKLQKWLAELWTDMRTEVAWKVLYGIILLLTLADAYLQLRYHGKWLDLRPPVAGILIIPIFGATVLMATAPISQEQARKILRFITAMFMIAAWVCLFPW